MAQGIRIFWTPSTAVGIVRYEVSRAALPGDPFTLLDLVQHQVPGPHYDAALGRFFYDDPLGSASARFRVVGVDGLGVAVADTGPFQPASAVAASLDALKRVDHDFGSPDALRYVTQGGSGVEQAMIRVYKKPDFDAGRRDLAVAATQTREDGRWAASAFVEPGLTYVVQFQKLNSYGPDVATIVV